MALEGRTYSGEGYRFGFQAQEQDAELWEGAVTYKYRVEDPRLGRFFSVDPLSKRFVYNSNYAFSENRLIDGTELEGLEFTVRIYPRASDRPHIEVVNERNLRDVPFGYIKVIRYSLGAFHDEDRWCPGCGSTSHLNKIKVDVGIVTISMLNIVSSGTSARQALDGAYAKVESRFEDLENTTTITQQFSENIKIVDRTKEDPESFRVTGVVTYEVQHKNVTPVITTAVIVHPDPMSSEALSMSQEIQDRYGIVPSINKGEEIAVVLFGSLDSDIQIDDTTIQIDSVQSTRTGETVQNPNP